MFCATDNIARNEKRAYYHILILQEIGSSGKPESRETRSNLYFKLPTGTMNLMRTRKEVGKPTCSSLTEYQEQEHIGENIMHSFQVEMPSMIEWIAQV